MKDIFIIGSKGIPARYGGFETFVDNLTKQLINNKEFKIHVSNMFEVDDSNYNNVDNFYVKTPFVGKIRPLIYNILALEKSIKYIKENNNNNFVFYVLSYGIGPFFNYYSRKIHKLNGKLIVNPDGKEYERGKWNKLIQTYFKYAEKQMMKYSDVVVCDSKQIQVYLNNKYLNNNKTIYIPYGSNESKSLLKDNDRTFTNWLNTYDLKPNKYYLMVGRLVPENNHKIIIENFVKSKTNKDLVIISTENKKYKNQLKAFPDRIKFVGSVYDQELLKKIRENAYAYIHGHEVGGTNPSLLESLYLTNINLLLDVPYNKEVGKDTAFYWNKTNLTDLINEVELTKINDINKKAIMAKKNIIDNYSWEKVTNDYTELFNKL